MYLAVIGALEIHVNDDNDEDDGVDDDDDELLSYCNSAWDNFCTHACHRRRSRGDKGIGPSTFRTGMTPQLSLMRW